MSIPHPQFPKKGACNDWKPERRKENEYPGSARKERWVVVVEKPNGNPGEKERNANGVEAIDGSIFQPKKISKEFHDEQV
jgi:hypothetical protein